MVMIILLALVPMALILEYFVHPSPILLFFTSAISIVPLAIWIQRATEQIAKQAGAAIGGLLNITFGNAAELILALFVLSSGNLYVVKGQITGSIISNSLLGLGFAIVLGSLKRPVLKFDRDAAGRTSTMLVLVLIGLMVPALFDVTERTARSPNTTNLDEYMSLGVSIVLILLYAAGMVYSLASQRDVFHSEPEDSGMAPWPVGKSILILVAATAFTAWEAEITSSALESAAKSLHITTFFLGIIVLALVGNIAEYVAGITFARKDNMGMAMSIMVGATIQVALLVAPLLVIISFLIHQPMNLVFADPLELIAIAGVALIVSSISRDGEVNWFEGALLIGVYLLLAIAFYFATPLT